MNIPLDGLEPKTDKKHVSYDSVARYQGLEFPIVIFTNFTRNIDEETIHDLYIGLTRSSNHLIIIGKKANFESIKKLTGL